MLKLIVAGIFLWFLYMSLEAAGVRSARRKLVHVIHVNGTRGKSTVCRLIDAGLRAGGYKVFCKTTGTVPSFIDVSGAERLIPRRGIATIKEQITTLRMAAKEGAQILVTECMALRPELQYASQHAMLKADIGVITNVRRDHTDIMGETISDIAQSLSNTVPSKGVFFSAERTHSAALREKALQQSTKYVEIAPDGTEPPIDFAENVALALAVCSWLGVPADIAAFGMEQCRKDPYALSLYHWRNAVFINGFSVNDIDSICLVWDKVCKDRRIADKKLILLVNNRDDRGSRTKDMAKVCCLLQPHEVWLMGAAREYMRRKLHNSLPNTVVMRFQSAMDISNEALNEECVIFAIGNIANDGLDVMNRVREEGNLLVL